MWTISDEVLAALIATRHRLAIGLIRPWQVETYNLHEYQGCRDRPSNFFNMNYVLVEYAHIGRIGCIGGWVWHHMNGRMPSGIEACTFIGDLATKNERVRELFFARTIAARRLILPQDACQAIDNFVLEVDPIWDLY